MAVMPDAPRRELWAEFMRDGGGIPLTKAQLRAAVDAVDDWLEANKATLNQMFPEPAKSALSPAQKVDLFTRIAKARFKTGAYS